MQGEEEQTHPKCILMWMMKTTGARRRQVNGVGVEWVTKRWGIESIFLAYGWKEMCLKDHRPKYLFPNTRSFFLFPLNGPYFSIKLCDSASWVNLNYRPVGRKKAMYTSKGHIGENIWALSVYSDLLSLLLRDKLPLLLLSHVNRVRLRATP